MQNLVTETSNSGAFQYHPAVVQITVVLEFIIETAETPLGNYVSIY